MRKYSIGLKALLLIFLLVAGCDRGYVPKPGGYLRVNYPEKEYILFDKADAFSLECPVYSEVVPSRAKAAEPDWYDIVFPEYNATIHLSYKQLSGDIESYIEDSRTLVYKHTARSDGIQETPFVDPDNRRFGILYELSGSVASPVQFFLTDSINHFLRGSLYFRTTPNRDSLNPIIGYVTKDIEHMIETVRWK